MQIRIEFPCIQDPSERHYAVLDVRNYPDEWRVLRSDVMETPLVRDFDPCAQLLTKGVVEDTPIGEPISFYEVFQEAICKQETPLPQKGMVRLLERMFRDDRRLSWNEHHPELKAHDHANLVRRVIGKYTNSRERFELFIRWNNLSLEHAFAKTCLELNPDLATQIAAKLLRKRYKTEPPGWCSHASIYIEMLLHPAGHRRLVRYFEGIDHEKTVRNFLWSSEWYERERSMQYSKLALVTLDSLLEDRLYYGLNQLDPSLQKRAMRVLKTVYHHLLALRKGRVEEARREFAEMLQISPMQLPRF